MTRPAELARAAELTQAAEGGRAAERRPWRIAVAVLAASMVAVALIGVAVPASAAAKPVGDCTTTSGVILAVDFSHWGGPVLRSCGTTPTTGYQLLNQGGWRTAGDNHDGPAFVCRIGYSGFHGGTQYPTPSTEACIVTPPASAYWSYWHADPGQHTWSYSQLGAMSYHPKPGSVDLWFFGSTNVAGTRGGPTFSPDSVRAHNTAPIGTPTATRTAVPPAQHTTAPPPPGGPTATTAATGATAGGPISGGLSVGGPTGGGPGVDGATTDGTTSGGEPPGGTTPIGPVPAAGAPPAGTAGPEIEDAPPPTTTAAHVSHGSSIPAVIALVIVLLLAAAGITAVLRRPRRES
jgi:hypothetical protein